MFFTIRFNAALAALGINPTLVPAEYREIGQVHGKMAGCTPQEAVLITLAELPMELQMMGNPMIANFGSMTVRFAFITRPSKSRCYR